MEHFPTERRTRQEMEARSATPDSDPAGIGSDASHAGTRESRNLQRPDASMRLPRGFGQTGNLPGVDRHIAQFATSLLVLRFFASSPGAALTQGSRPFHVRETEHSAYGY